MSSVAARMFLAAVCLLTATAGWPQSYPSKPVRMVIGFSPGSTTDLIGRVVANGMTAVLSQPVVVDNRPGAGANIAAELVAKAAPDGYSLLLANAGIATGATAYVKLNFNAMRDFTPVSLVSATPHILVAHPSLPARSVRELIAFTRTRPGELNFSSTGHGNSDHLAAELFSFMTGLKMVHVTYKGGPQALGDVATGQVAMYFAGLPSALPFVKMGRVRPLGVTGSRRAAAVPDVPTIAEAGVPGYEHILWSMLLVPAAASKDVVTRLNEAAAKALGTGEVRERFAGMGVDATPSTPERAATYLRSETEKYSKVVKAIGLRIE
jgi:tripartite-type tricarboxylate transporter receptor subunit TctC